MFETLKKYSKASALAAGVSLVALSGAAYAANPVGISGVEVTTALGAAEDSNALALYPTLNTDLEAAIAQRVTGGDVTDPKIEVSIREIALDGATMLPESKEFNQMDGVVSLAGAEGDLGGVSFPVRINAVMGDATAPAGYIVLAPTEGDFYIAMVNAFADSVAAQLAEKNVGTPPTN